MKRYLLHFLLIIIMTLLFDLILVILRYFNYWILIGEGITLGASFFVFYLIERKSYFFDWFFVEDKHSKQLLDMGILKNNTVRAFAGDFAFLSNNYKTHFILDSVLFDNVWHYFFASRPAHQNIRDKILSIKNINRISKLSVCSTPRANWDKLQMAVMRSAVVAKFLQNKELKLRLIATKGLVLQNGNFHGDTIWGIDLHSGEGQNLLGKILMDLRQKLCEEKHE